MMTKVRDLPELVPVEVYEIQAELGRLLANPKRLEILYHLKDGKKSVGQLAELMEVPMANVSQHLSILKSKRILTTRRDGTTVYYMMSSPTMQKACGLMREAMMELVQGV